MNVGGVLAWSERWSFMGDYYEPMSVSIVYKGHAYDAINDMKYW